ncbi:acetyltransferase [Vibrio cholerae]|nr:acetyltransferase [Vibrio cholerae]
MVSVVVFEFSVMRCQPLRRALAVFIIISQSVSCKMSKKGVIFTHDEIRI